MNNFISEKDIEKQKIKRQEEWEKVRQHNDPTEVPDEPYESRSLYERLQEQKDKKQQEFEESIKFKNQFRGVTKDEVEFLDQLAQQTMEKEKLLDRDVKKELADFKKAVVEKNTLLHKNEVLPAHSNVSQSLKVKHTSLQSNLVQKSLKRKGASIVASKSDHSAKAIKIESVDSASKVLPGMSSYTSDSNSSAVSSSSDSETN